MKLLFVLFWVAYLANQAAGKLHQVNGIPMIRLRSDRIRVSDNAVAATVGAGGSINSLVSIRGGAKSPIYLLYRKLSRILRPYFPKSWRKLSTLGGDSSKKGRYGKAKGKKSDAKDKHGSTSSTSNSAKHNRLQKVKHFPVCIHRFSCNTLLYITSLHSQEIQEFITNPPDNCKLKINGNIRNWEVTLTGVNGTIYEGEIYKLKMVFPKDYPAKPPSVYFLKPCPKHVHVYTNGDICLNFLGRDWRPTMTGQMLAVSILSMLSSAKEKRMPQDNAMHADAKPGDQQHNWMYHDDRC